MFYQNIILTGFMGTGKTTVGKLLSQKLNYKFVDTDEMIMLRYNMTISEIFKTKGEQEFRKMEHELALELAQNDRQVISTGGKMMLNSANVDALEGKSIESKHKKGKIFCLAATPEEIISRVLNDNKIERPLLQVSDPAKEVVKLLNERKQGYEKFIQIDTTGKTVEDICGMIIEL